jgi:hypothetical protein
MQGQQYLSPRKTPGKKLQFASIVDKGRSISKISERKAKAPLPLLQVSRQEVEEQFERMKEEQKTKRGTTVQSRAYGPTYEGCFGFENDGGFGDGNDGGFGDDMSMGDIECRYAGDSEENGSEESDNEDEEDESFETMRLAQLELERAKSYAAMERFNEYARQFRPVRRRPYPHKLKRFKKHWKEFINCVTGDLAWIPIAPPTGVQPCDCTKSIDKLPAVTWSGTSFL